MKPEILVERVVETEKVDERVCIQVHRCDGNYQVSVSSTRTVSTVYATCHGTLVPAFDAALRAAVLQGISFSSAITATRLAYEDAKDKLFPNHGTSYGRY